MSIGIFPNVKSTKLNRDAKQGTSVCSRTARSKNNRGRSQKRALTLKTENDDKAAVAIVKTVPQWSCVSQDSEPSRLQRSVKHQGNPRQKVLGPIRRVRFTVYAPSSNHPRKKGTSLAQIQVKTLHQRSPYAIKFEDSSREETERQERCARSKAWNLAKIFTSSRKRRKLPSIRLSKSGLCQPHQPQNRRKESLW